MIFRQIYSVARREYLARVRNKAFVVTTLLVPVFLVFQIVVLPRILERAGTEELNLVVIDEQTGLGGLVAQKLEAIPEPRVKVSSNRVVAQLSEEIRAQYSEAVRGDEIDGYLVLQPDAEMVATARYYGRETGNPVNMNRLEGAFETALLEEVLAGSGVDVAQVRRVFRFDLPAITISDADEKEGGFETALYSTLALAMLLYMAVLISGQGMAMSIVEEKTSRLIEVILGAVTSMEFMAGKIVGVLLSGLTQLGIWVVCALIATLYALPGLAVAASATGFDLAEVVNPTLIFYFAVFFTLGYALYATMFAAIAATCNSSEELGQSLLWAIVPLIAALVCTIWAIQNPSDPTTRILSLIPFLTPLVMLARINVLMPPLWEIWLSVLLLAIASVAAAWVTSKVFRFALLMHGKRPSIPEMARLIRMG